MGCIGKSLCKLITFAACIATVVISCIILWLIVTDLSDVDFNLSILNPLDEDECLLGSRGNGSSLCLYMYFVVGVGFLCSILLSILQMWTCNCCGLGNLFDFIFTILTSLMWIVAACIMTPGVKDANEQDRPEEGSRNTVLALTWTNAVLYTIMAVTRINKCRENCGCGGDDDDEAAEKVAKAAAVATA